MSQSIPHPIGVVSYLNARPLVEGLEHEGRVTLLPGLPATLLERLLSGEVEAALLPAIDYQTSPQELAVLPVGAIGSDGETFTVRVFSRVPLETLDEIHVDGDSHTSVALLRILFRRRFGRRPHLVSVPMPRRSGEWEDFEAPPRAMLMIGDKVVAAAPPSSRYPYQLDLGLAWKEMTGLPFVFALWMARTDARLGGLPGILSSTLERNLQRIGAIASRHAGAAGWPEELARRYLGEILTYTVGPRELEAVQLFWRMAHEEGLTPGVRPLITRS